MARMVQVNASRTRGLPVVALVGRPNVGKSTLFNRLTGGRKAIVDNLPGITRDRNYAQAEWYGRNFVLIDTGGFESDPGTALGKQIQDQSRLAIEEADIILFLFDGKAGLNPLDRDAVELLRRIEKPVFFAVNKIDTQPKEARLYEFYAMGLPEIFPLSAEHGLGLSEIMDRIVGALPAGPDEIREGETKTLSIAIVGRPNVGKSSLVNTLLGFERSVVDSVPGTTRDAVASLLMLGGVEYILIDTAGIRRKARIVDRIERYSVIRSLGSVDRADLILHLLDGPEGVTDQDAQILAYAFQRGKGLVLAVNKWDLVPQEQKDARSYRAQVYQKLSFVDFAPIVFISALTGHGVPQMTAIMSQVAQAYQRRIQTSKLNQALQQVVVKHRLPLAQGREVKFYYATQTASRPPTFALFVNYPEGVTPVYERYLVRQLRLALGLKYSPMRLVVRARREPRGSSDKRIKGFRVKEMKGSRDKEFKGLRVKGVKRKRSR